MTPPRRMEDIFWFVFLESSLKGSGGRGQNNYTAAGNKLLKPLWIQHIICLCAFRHFLFLFLLLKQLILQLLIIFRASLTTLENVWKLEKLEWGSGRGAEDSLFPLVGACRMGPSSVGCFLGYSIGSCKFPCWDSYSFLGDLLLAVRKCVFHVSLFFLILSPLLSALSSMPPLNHLFLACSPSLLPKCQTENCAVFFFLVKILQKSKSSFTSRLDSSVSLHMKPFGPL